VADDGLIEAIESVDDNWVVGIQWHPEANLPAPELRQLFATLKAEAEKTLLGIS
jgi:putative glutamine amidotransferase